MRLETKAGICNVACSLLVCTGQRDNHWGSPLGGSPKSKGSAANRSHHWSVQYRLERRHRLCDQNIGSKKQYKNNIFGPVLKHRLFSRRLFVEQALKGKKSFSNGAVINMVGYRLCVYDHPRFGMVLGVQKIFEIDLMVATFKRYCNTLQDELTYKYLNLQSFLS